MCAMIDRQFFAADGRYLPPGIRIARDTLIRVGPPTARPRPIRRRRIEHLSSIPRVIDVSQYSRRSRMSGIPRVVRALLASEAGGAFTPVVWDRGALCPVTVDAEGDVTFPPDMWRRAPGVPLAERIQRWLRDTRPGAVLAGLLGVLGIARVAVIAAELAERRGPRGPRRPTRARCTVDLRGAELVIPEVVRRSDAETLLTLLDNGGDVEIRLFVHDLLPLSHPEYFERSAVLDHVNLMRIAAASSDIVTSSDLMAAQVRTTLEGLFGMAPPVRVAELPVTTPRSIGDRSPRPSRTTLLFIGGFEARKGIDLLLDALGTDDWPFDVIVVGQPRHHRPDEIRSWRRARRVDSVHIQPPVADRQLAGLLSRASAVLYLSAAEGYGLPVIEALHAHTPVVAADSAINREFADRYGGVHLVPLDGRCIDARALREALRSAPWKAVPTHHIRADRIPQDAKGWARHVLGGVA